TDFILGDITRANMGGDLPPFGSAGSAQVLAIDRALYIQAQLYNQQGSDVYGDLPRLQNAVRQVPDPKLAAELSAHLLQLQAEVPVLVLLRAERQLLWAIGGELYVGVSLFSGNADRDAWTSELRSLDKKFLAELRQQKHPDLDKRVTDWEKDLRRLH